MDLSDTDRDRRDRLDLRDRRDPRQFDFERDLAIEHIMNRVSLTLYVAVASLMTSAVTLLLLWRKG